MDLLATATTWQVCIAIFLLRIVDVSIGTIRTIAVVRGRPSVAVVLGFFEVLVWLLAISQVLARVMQEPIVALSYAGGFAAGNGVGNPDRAAALVAPGGAAAAVQQAQAADRRRAARRRPGAGDPAGHDAAGSDAPRLRLHVQP
jgi:hypothetical protein